MVISGTRACRYMMNLDEPANYHPSFSRAFMQSDCGQYYRKLLIDCPRGRTSATVVGTLQLSDRGGTVPHLRGQSFSRPSPRGRSSAFQWKLPSGCGLYSWFTFTFDLTFTFSSTFSSVISIYSTRPHISWHFQEAWVARWEDEQQRAKIQK